VQLRYKQRDTNNAVKKRIVPYLNALKRKTQAVNTIFFHKWCW